MPKKLILMRRDYLAIDYFSYHSSPSHTGRVDSIFLMNDCLRRILDWWNNAAREPILELIMEAVDLRDTVPMASIQLRDMLVVPPNFHRKKPWYTIRIYLQEGLGDPLFRPTVNLRIPAASVQDKAVKVLEVTHISAEHDLMNGSVVLWEEETFLEKGEINENKTDPSPETGC